MLLTVGQTRELINRGDFDRAFSRLYVDVSARLVRDRYLRAIGEFERLFGSDRKITLISAPGRAEIGGNHTDHQCGCVLAAAVDLDVVCIASHSNAGTIRVSSKGYPPQEVSLDVQGPLDAEKGKPASLIRGAVFWFRRNGFTAGGFDAYITSDVLEGSGLSSSAAFEVAIGSALNTLYNGGSVTPVEIALASRYAENVYFGKPSGLMDQIASAHGGLVYIDFAIPGSPAVSPIAFDLTAAGYSLFVVDTKGSHVGLTSSYAAIPAEMQAVASVFDRKYLNDVDENEFYSNVPLARERAGDRAVLRAMHFYSENARVNRQKAALESGDLDLFLRLVVESGESSVSCLQNIYAEPEVQDLSVALAVSRRILSGHGGAWRVHGGGFAGTIQAFVPDNKRQEYRTAIDSIFGTGSCRALTIRPVGGIELWLN